MVFALFAAFLVGYFALNTRRLINEQIVGTVDAEVTALTNQYNQAGIRRLVVIIDLRSRRPGSSLYLVTTPTGQGLAGNVASLEPGILESQGWVETAYRRLEEPESAEHNALVRVTRLPGGIRLLVGRDLDERERMFRIVAVAGRWSAALVVVLGVIGGIFVSRRVLARVEAMTATAQTIMAGDLSGRLSVTGTGDEFDRLALNLNGMLEETIEESVGLIRTFDALLMIARAESGEVRDGMAEFDVAAVARDVGELYEPLAEDKGLSLEIQANEHATVKGNRELVSQALANLVDNAIKYSAPAAKHANGERAGIVVETSADKDHIMLSVSDHGPGIPVGDRSRVVERFVRLEQSRTEPGSGLGLSLVSAVARLHGGELKLEDNSPGLRSIIALPRAGPAGTG